MEVITKHRNDRDKFQKGPRVDVAKGVRPKTDANTK